MKVFLAALVHETNSFSPLPTTLRSFAEGGLLHRAGDPATFERARSAFGYGDAFTALADAGDEIVAGPCAWAMPSGVVSRRAYEALRDELLDALERAGEIDAVVLFLHGAMLADGYPDCEGDLLARARRVVGAKVPIGVLLDLHGNVSEAMVASGAILVACKEYPHTDYPERCRELRTILANAVALGSMPVTLLRQVPMVALLGTTDRPMHDYVRRLEASEGHAGILSVSAMQGFAWADTPDMGASILVVHESGGDAAMAAEALAAALADELFAIRATGMSRNLPLEPALDRALMLAAEGGPVVFADGSDNPGGGAACDSTFVLRALIERRVEAAALGMVWDPQAASIAADAGVGARIPLRIGGKVGPLSGDPVDASVEVIAVRSDALQSTLGREGSGDPLGLAVAVRIGGIEVVINSIRHQTHSPSCFRELGIDLSAKRLVVVKSSQHFRAGFDPIASHTVYSNAPGSLNLDLGALPYRHIRRPLWPLDPVESAQDGRGERP